MTIIVTLTETQVVASSMIKRAMRLIGQLSPGKSPSVDETADCLEAMNAMLDSWRNDRLNAYAYQEETLNVTAGLNSYTIGAAGVLATNRPVAIEAAYGVYNGANFDVQVYNEKQWAGIANRTNTGNLPEAIYYQPLVPTANLYVAPVPGVSCTLFLVTRLALMSFTDSATTAYLAPGWKEAIETNLAIEIAPEFNKPISQELAKMARDSKSAMRRANSRPFRLRTELRNLVGGQSSYNVTTDR